MTNVNSSNGAAYCEDEFNQMLVELETDVRQNQPANLLKFMHDWCVKKLRPIDQGVLTSSVHRCSQEAVEQNLQRSRSRRESVATARGSVVTAATSFELRSVYGVAGGILELEDHPLADNFDYLVATAAEDWDLTKREAKELLSQATRLMRKSAEGGACFVIAPKSTLVDALLAGRLNLQSTDESYMRDRLKRENARSIFSENFAAIFKEFTAHAEGDAWPADHEAAGKRKDGGFVVAPDGKVLKSAAKFQLDLTQACWPGKGTRHLAALGMALLFPDGVVLVRSESGSMHLLAGEFVVKGKVFTFDSDTDLSAFVADEEESDLDSIFDEDTDSQIFGEEEAAYVTPGCANEKNEELLNYEASEFDEALRVMLEASTEFACGSQRDAIDLMNRAPIDFAYLATLKDCHVSKVKELAYTLTTKKVCDFFPYCKRFFGHGTAEILDAVERVDDSTIEDDHRGKRKFHLAWLFHAYGDAEHLERARRLHETVYAERQENCSDKTSPLEFAESKYALSVVNGDLGAIEQDKQRRCLYFGQEQRLAKEALSLQREHGALAADIALTLQRLAIAYSHMGNNIEAKETFEDVLRQQASVSELFLARTKHLYAQTLGQLGYWGRARQLLEEALATQERTLGKGHDHVACTLHELVETCGELSDNVSQQQYSERLRASRKRADQEQRLRLERMRRIRTDSDGVLPMLHTLSSTTDCGVFAPSAHSVRSQRSYSSDYIDFSSCPERCKASKGLLPCAPSLPAHNVAQLIYDAEPPQPEAASYQQATTTALAKSASDTARKVQFAMSDELTPEQKALKRDVNAQLLQREHRRRMVMVHRQLLEQQVLVQHERRQRLVTLRRQQLLHGGSST